MISLYLSYMIPRIGLILFITFVGTILVGCASSFIPHKTEFAQHEKPLPPGTKVEVFLGHYSGCRGEVVAQLGGNRYLTRMTCVSWEERTLHLEEPVQGEYLREIPQGSR
jgi:hypothetical protein